jgi:hypothetical protein
MVGIFPRLHSKIDSGLEAEWKLLGWPSIIRLALWLGLVLGLELVLGSVFFSLILAKEINQLILQSERLFSYATSWTDAS